MTTDDLSKSASSDHAKLGELRWAAQLLTTTLVYWVAGKLAVLMAIPPGYATSVWPAAGFALAAVLVWGKRVAPGIALGSFLVNVGTSFDASSGGTVAKSLVLALLLAVGATLQAVIGAHLIQRFVGSAAALQQEPAITRFTLLGGPVACLVSPSIGVGTLCLGGIVPRESFAFSWWTWWVGDAIGVLLFAPVSLVFLPGPHALWRRGRAVIALPLLGSFALVTLLFLQASSWEQDRVRTEFERRAVHLAQALESTMSEYQQAVTFLASLFYASNEVTRSEFAVFAGRALDKYTGIQALGWSPHVPEAERERHEARARAEGLADFRFSERAGSGSLERAGQRATYLPFYYLEPLGQNRARLGFDNASDPVRAAALARAAGSGSPSATPPMALAHTQGDELSVTLFVPVFQSSDPKAPEHELRGYTVGVFRIKDVVESALGKLDRANMSLMLFEDSAPGGEQLLYASARPQAEAPQSKAEGTAWSTGFDFGGHRYRLQVQANPSFLLAEQSWQAWLVLAVGLLFARIMGVATLMTSSRASRAQTLNIELEERVHARTQALSAALKERDVLLQEIHHRVKNNLQVISSLINMQVRRLPGGVHRDALTDCQSRVQAIALIHDALYQSRDYSEIPFSDYARSLSKNVFHLAGAAPSLIALELDIADVSLAVDKAIPCGLILNELLVNALKHAFPEGRPGTVRVELGRVDAERLALRVKDDGVGIPPDVDVSSSGRLGLQLVRTLAGQLDAELAVKHQRGTAYELSFSAGQGS